MISGPPTSPCVRFRAENTGSSSALTTARSASSTVVGVAVRATGSVSNPASAADCRSIHRVRRPSWSRTPRSSPSATMVRIVPLPRPDVRANWVSEILPSMFADDAAHIPCRTRSDEVAAPGHRPRPSSTSSASASSSVRAEACGSDPRRTRRQTVARLHRYRDRPASPCRRSASSHASSVCGATACNMSMDDMPRPLRAHVSMRTRTAGEAAPLPEASPATASTP